MSGRITAQAKIAALEKVAGFISSIGQLKKLLAEIMLVSEEMLDAEASSVLLYDASSRELWFEVALGEKGRQMVRKRIKLGQGIAGCCAQTGKIINCDARKDSRFFRNFDQKSGFRTESVLALPLKRNKRLLGVLEILNKKGGKTFRAADIALAKIIAAQAAVAIENAQLYSENLKNARMAAVGQTIAGVSHDIKNILTGLNGGMELVDIGLESERGEVLTDGWQMVKRNVGRISELTLDMLNYSRDKGPNIQPADINGIVTAVVRLYAEKIAEKKGSFQVWLDERLKLALVDPAGMERVILNLISNACDALPPENGCIGIRTVRRPRTVSIEVSDNGCGIPADKLANIFDMFFTTKGSKGTGIGLAVVHKIVKEHRGRIAVDSQPARGTTFAIEIPYRVPDETRHAGG